MVMAKKLVKKISKRDTRPALLIAGSRGVANGKRA
jgi:hypothetical protein